MKNKISKRKKIILIVLIVLGLLILLYFPVHTFIEDSDCFYGGGFSKMFSDGCGDSCLYAIQGPENPVFCTQAFQRSCDCGKNECWDDERKKCVPN